VIVLHAKKIAIMTPPKCGTNTLHFALRIHPWTGESYCGPSPASIGISEGDFDRHINCWPGEVKRFPNKLVVVRKPETRLVSQYLHMTSRLTGKGLSAPSFAEIIDHIISGEESRPLYSWNLTRWLAGVDFDDVLRMESLQDDLAKHGIEIKDMPAVNVSYKGQSYMEFYTPELLERIEPWVEPDRTRWYSEPVAAASGM